MAISPAHAKVKFLKHAPPYMPGDVTTIPVDKAAVFEGRGVVAILGKAEAPPERRAPLAFDPAFAPIDEVRAFIAGRGKDIPEKAAEPKLREQAAALLAGSVA
jgi:hypothetical protein